MPIAVFSLSLVNICGDLFYYSQLFPVIVFVVADENKDDSGKLYIFQHPIRR